MYCAASTLLVSLTVYARACRRVAMSGKGVCAQTLPVERGRGMGQPGMRAAHARLAAGDWVHIFPEGTRSRDGSAMGPVRAGVGRLVAGCGAADPVVLPIVHEGMQHVMPRGSAVPVPGQQVPPLAYCLILAVYAA